MYKKSGLTNYGIVTGTVVGVALTAAMPAIAQRLPNRLHGPVRVDSKPIVNQRIRTINKRAPSSNAPDAAVPGSAVGGPIVKRPVQPLPPAIALPTPHVPTPSPTQRASNAPALNDQRDASPAAQERTVPARNGDATRAAPVVVQRAPGDNPSAPDKAAPLPPVKIDANPVPEARRTAEQIPNESPEATQRAGERLAQLRKERFRRRAAESAQKEIEQMADQLREQLGKEISARLKAEGVAAELVSRASLENQIDKERDRLRTEKIKALQKRRVLLEREVSTLTLRLADERAKRRQLEQDKTALTQAVATTQRNATSEINLDALKSQVAELTRKLNAAEWARKLAEAQLRVLMQRRGTIPSGGSGQSN